jgi:hypothetical protein
MVGRAWHWFHRLAHRGKDATCFPSALASFSASAVRCGRRLAGQEKGKDVLSPLVQRRQHILAFRLPDSITLGGDPLSEALVDSTVSPVPEQVAFRTDFAAWLSSLGERNRALAKDMVLGHCTRELARSYGTRKGRISQLRRHFQLDWTRFCGDRLLRSRHGLASTHRRGQTARR